jgi:hypothetical protein
MTRSKRRIKPVDQVPHFIELGVAFNDQTWVLLVFQVEAPLDSGADWLKDTAVKNNPALLGQSDIVHIWTNYWQVKEQSQ